MSVERIEMYNKGGVFFIMLRIFIVDMLNECVLFKKVVGIMVNNVYCLMEICVEVFIVRLF